MRYTGRTGWKASNRDVWDLPSALNPIITAALEKFISTDRMGVPGDLFKEYKDSYTDTEEDEASKLWEETLDKMLYAFSVKEPNLEDYDVEFYWTLADSLDEIEIVSHTAMNIRYRGEAEYKRLNEDKRIHQLKVKEGLDLFAKHYRSLWD